MSKLNIQKKDVVIFAIILIVSTILLVFVNNNFRFYTSTIVKINNIEEEKIDPITEPNILGIEENYYLQKITGTIMNGKDKRKTVLLENERSTSGVVDEKYEKGDYVFVNGNDITGLKRDVYIVIVIIIFVFLLFTIGKFKGLLSIVSVIFNTIIFCIGIKLYTNGLNIILLILIESIIFTVISLILTNGFNKNTLSAIISVIVSMLVLSLMVLLIVGITKYKNVNFNGMSFLTVPPEAIFTAELLIGGLGAIMDVCITITSSIKELIDKDNNIKTKSLINSSRNIGKDIMGTMINVLFFTYLSGCLPIFVLSLRNGVSLTNYIQANFSLELTRFFVGSIGIVLAIPIASLISIKFYRRGEGK